MQKGRRPPGLTKEEIFINMKLKKKIYLSDVLELVLNSLL
jgi:hypothetical protein